MGMDLRRGEDGISVGLKTWTRIFALAIEGGWEPLGTLPSKHLSKADQRAWEGAYDGNNGQIITDEDAKNMADGLETMLNRLGPSVPDNGPESEHGVSLGYDQPSDYFNTENRRKQLRAVIEFLRAGQCEVW